MVKWLVLFIFNIPAYTSGAPDNAFMRYLDIPYIYMTYKTA